MAADTVPPDSLAEKPQRTSGGPLRWTPPTPEELEAQLPGYTIEKILGRGGMGAVYKGVQTNLDRTVALKILPPGVEQEDPTFAERFKSEARLMARLSSPAVVAVYDFGLTTGGLLYFAMEYVDGTDVSRMIRSQGKLPPEHALAITAHVCDALAAAHELGIVHRDIKPANVLLNMKGQVKVADFGLAKVEEPGSHGLTKTGYAMGTPDFVAPEVLMLGSNIDGRADLYAVGVMLYQMLTGEVPRGAFKPATVRLPGLDPRFDPIILKAMQSDREERYQSSTELRRDLDVILTVPLVCQDEPPSAAIPAEQVAQTPAQRSAAQKPDGRRVRQNAVPAAAPERTLASAPTAKSNAPLFLGLAAAAAISIGAFVMFGRQGSHRADDAEGRADGPPSAAAKPQTPIAQPSTPPAKSTPVKVAETSKPAPAPKPAAVVETQPASPPETIAPAMAASKPEPTQTTTAAPVSPPPVSPSPSLPVSESAPSALDQRLAALDSGFQAAVERDANTAFKASIAALDKLYLGALDRALANASKGGKLEEALALRTEKQRIEKGEGVPSEVDESTSANPVPATLKTLRQTYRSTTAQHAATKFQAMQPLYDKYDQALATVQTELTKANQLDDAMRVKTVREQIAATRGGATDPPAAANSSASTRPPSAALAGASAPPSNSSFLITKDKTFTNSLGMKFVPVPNSDILMCIHETRYKDYAVYAAAEPGADGTWKDQSVDGFTPTENNEDHPVTKVRWEDTQMFCSWLSKKEGKTYRLPTDQEWSIAVGIGRDEKWKKDTTPATVFKDQTDFPWGDKWPPPKGSGNFSDDSRKAKAPNATAQYLENYDDDFPTTAPVMSFKPNKLGLYDLDGNVREWVEDWYDNAKNDRALRGGCWFDGVRAGLLSSYRRRFAPGTRHNYIGFRIVLEIRAPANPSGAAAKPATPTPPPVPPAPAPTPATAAKSDFTNSLGMKFVKVPGTKVLFCIHETRNKDFSTYVAENPGITLEGEVDEPVKLLKATDARLFCAWLTKKEGRNYRLPTDKEWDAAVGLRRSDDPDEFPWGRRWPPPKAAANLSPALKDYADDFPKVAPVMRFTPNKYGIYDLSGNMWEVCEATTDTSSAECSLRGGSWTDYEAGRLHSSFRMTRPVDVGLSNNTGFRIVLETTD